MDWSDGMTDTTKPVTLKVLSEHLRLSPATISIVLNNAPAAKAIAVATRERVQEAAARFGYRPNVHAQMLGMRPRNSDKVDALQDHGETYSTKIEERMRRLYELEQENAKLKRLVADLLVDKAVLKDAPRH
jgi:DNA-binding LacI/PurR family transcriptional regulator